MNFELLLERMSEDEKAACEERLYILTSTSGIGYQVMANLRCESRLDELAFSDIVQGLLQAAADPEELKSVYIEKCQTHILKGGTIPKPWPLYFGRVVTRERFCKIALQVSDIEDVTMNKIKVSEIGEVDIKSIENLSYDELKEWIELRLHGKDTQIPSDFRQGDTPYYIISLLYPKFNRYVREDINHIVLQFAKDMARNPGTIWKGEAGHQLLLLINSIRAKETLGFLLEMAEARNFFAEDVPSLEEDLRLRVLQTLVSLGYRAGHEFWLEQYHLAPQRYAKIVFNGLALIAPEQAIRFMSSIDSIETVERILFITFPSLLNEYGATRIVLLVEEYLPKMEPGVCAAVQSFFADEGHDLRYQPRKTKFDYERIHRESFC